MSKSTNDPTSAADDLQVVATSTLRDALDALGLPRQAAAVLAGFKAVVPKQDLLGSSGV